MKTPKELQEPKGLKRRTRLCETGERAVLLELVELNVRSCVRFELQRRRYKWSMLKTQQYARKLHLKLFWSIFGDTPNH